MTKSRVNKSLWDSESILQLRRHMGLTQSELADELGTRQQTISEWELGMYQPRGTSKKLLTIVAERANFKYDAGTPKSK
ncbi:MAG: helix-turn-helix domain-containing protein [Dehalococcoidales bacterium]|nr:helix-turn-helix domain-containing protein [Dehalococcoidales bacterium]